LHRVKSRTLPAVERRLRVECSKQEGSRWTKEQVCCEHGLRFAARCAPPPPGDCGKFTESRRRLWTCLFPAAHSPTSAMAMRYIAAIESPRLAGGLWPGPQVRGRA
jgi:hypothetical protein